MPKSFYALITPLASTAHPEHPIELPPAGELPGEPPGIWGGAGEPMPTPPIVIPPIDGKPPVTIWPRPPGSPAHPIVIPDPPSIEHPIVLPPMIWPEPPDGKPPIGLDPGKPEHPIVLPKPPPPAHPEHPIVMPVPPELWPKPGRPEHPIVIPPEEPTDPMRPIDWQIGWTEDTGWVVVGVPQFPHPAPAAAGRRRAK